MALTNVHGKKIHNTITGVKFVPELDYNLIATGVLEKKGCKITQEKGRIVIIDEDDGLTFMTGICQPSAIGNSYTLDLWKPPTSWAKVLKTSTFWTQWHCHLGHLDNAGNENQMPSPPVPAATTPAEPPIPCRSSQKNSCLGGQGNKDPGNERRSHGFAGKVRKTRTVDLDYHIPNNSKEVLVHPDKDKYVQGAKEEINHHKGNSTWRTLGLRFGSSEYYNRNLIGYTDALYAADADTFCSHYRYTVMLWNGLIT
ncbi:MAG: hypothetical protein FRX48_05274 [Lasallia pustulata]|uniref:GAG-pre-integrase domain-containing protein n=1 Tax=Lasallia pustulata TaxID=136370 RepID=A0A5M8PNC9_9LECA|nr:MAG: hypothetical protein FRX48_05274 [Lasallia pustulata]